jgi:teichoic acid transport system permease protein
VVTNPQLWISAIGWGVVIFVVGLVFFWQAEHKYGRG